MTVDAGKPHRGLIAESKRYGLLQIAPPDYRSITIISSQVRQRCRNRLHFQFKELERGPDLQDCVRYILCGCTPMTPLPVIIFAERSQLLNDWHHRVANALGCSLQLGEVTLVDVAVERD